MNCQLAACLALGLAVIAPVGRAEIGGLDDVPAATLLLPYFEVDLDDPLGRTTLFSVANARQEATVAHVTFWTDLGVPTLGFNVYLTGYDIQTINLRDVFVTGTLPRTASVGQDPEDDFSPGGHFSLDSDFPACTGQLPLPVLPETLLVHLRSSHVGGPSAVVFGGLCSAFDHGDNVARGYLTIDQVKDCTLDLPTDEGYFSAAILGFDNVLVGDYFYVDSGQNFAQGETMVHLEADSALGEDHYTFYRALSGGADRREGMGNLYLARFVDGGDFDGGTDFIAWRDSKREIGPFSCSLPVPAPFPLGQQRLVVFDEEENADEPFICPFTCPPGLEIMAFPFQTNRVQIGGPEMPVPWNFGAWYLDLNTAVPGSAVPFEPLSQAFVSVVMSAEGRFSVGFDAHPLSYVTVPEEAFPNGIPVCNGPPDPPACGP